MPFCFAGFLYSFVGSSVKDPVDSLQASFTLALLVHEACAMVQQGLGGAEIAAKLEALRLRTHFAAVFDTLDNLRKGGRISPTVSWFGNVLGIKPAITMREGKAALIGNVRGGTQKVISWLIEQAEAGGADFSSRRLAIAYSSDNSEDVKKFIAALTQKSVDTLNLLVVQIGAVIGTHVGEKALGLGYICPESTQSASSLVDVRDSRGKWKK
jgi:DegV family protein with EDD domain